ncbi:MAG: T9SS type A sorting domain-containing protein [Ignavibacteria bacterium]|nr:T9SS type A sorting domain-containing protein [Ignavibacteria bacterium]
MKNILIFLSLAFSTFYITFSQPNPKYRFYFNGNDITSICPVFGSSIFLFGSREAGIGAFDLDSFKYVGFFQKIVSPIPSHNIRFIKRFSPDTIWIGTDRGLIRFRSNQIVVFDTSNSDLPSNVINDITIDASGSKWIATDNGLVFYNDNTWTIYDISNSGLPSNYINYVKIDVFGNVWVATPNGLSMYDRNQWYVWNSSNSDLPDDHITFIEFDPINNSRWIGTLQGGLVNWVGNDFIVYDTSSSLLPSNTITSFAFEGTQNKWIGTSNGLVFISPRGWTVFNTSNSNLSDNYINTIYIAPNRLRLIGTRNKVTVVRDTIFLKVDFMNSLLPTNFVKEVNEGQDLVKWISTPYELVSYDGANWNVFNTRNSPLRKQINAIEVDNQNRVWVATDSGLFIRDRNSWSSYYYGLSGLPSNRVTHLLSVDNNMWIGTDSGLVLLKDGNWIRYDTIFVGRFSRVVSALAKSDRGRIYVGLGNNGVAVIEENNIWFYDAFNSPLFGLFVTSIGEDKFGKLYVGTAFQGLFTFDTVWVSHTPTTGFPDLTVLDITFDKLGFPWITTRNAGIVHIRDTNMYVYNEKNSPFYTNDFQSVFVDISNNKWIATRYGLYVFNQDTIKPELRMKSVPTSICVGNTVSVEFYSFYDFKPGNRFNIELSDSAGNFSRPLVIGSAIAIRRVPILCYVPTNIPASNFYRMRVVSTNPKIVSADNGFNISIHSLPKPVIVGDSVVCSAQIQRVWAKTELNHGYFWRVEGGSILNNPTSDTIIIRWDTVKTGHIILTAVNQFNCLDSAKLIVHISRLPGKILTGPRRVCSGQTFIYSTSDSVNIKNYWTVRNGVVESKPLNNIALIRWGNTSPGVIILKRVNEFGCVDSVRLTVEIYSKPNPTISGKKEAMKEEVVKYITKRANPQVVNNWSVTKGRIIGSSKGDTVTVGWAEPGIGKVKLVQVTPEGCFDSTELIVRIFEYAAMAGDTIVCENNETFFEAISNLGANSQWKVQGGTISGSSQNRRVWVRWGSSGTGRIKLVQWVTGSTFKDSIEKVVRILRKPTKPVITDSLGFLYSSAPYGNQWYFNGKILYGDTSNRILPLWTGYYTVQVTTAPGCTSEISDPYYAISSVEESKAHIHFYPNPTSEYLFLLVEDDLVGEIVVRDLLGTELKRFELISGQKQYYFDLKDLTSGTYLFEFNSKFTKEIHRIVVIK